MTLLDRYIIKGYLSTFFFILGIVILICVVVDFNEKIDIFLEKRPPVNEIIFDYYLNFIPFWGNLLAPICIYLGVIFFTSQMSQRSEIIPLLSSGVSFYRIMAPYLFTSFLLAGLSFFAKSYLVPIATERQIDFEYKYMGEVKKRVSSSKDIHKKVASDTYVYIQYYNEKQQEGHGFTMEQKKNSDFVMRLKADRILWVDSTESWNLKRVWIRDFYEEQNQLRYLTEMDTAFYLTPDDIFIKEMKAASMTLPQLLEYIRLEEMRGSDILEELYIEKNRRYADPFAVIILTLIGFAMSSRKSRGGIALQIGVGLFFSFFYITLLFAGQAIMGEEVPASVAIWIPNVLFFVLAVVLLRVAPK